MQWSLVVTKLMIFIKSKPKDDFNFMYNGKKRDFVDDFTYLEYFVIIMVNFRNQKNLVYNAIRASFSVIQKSRKLCLPMSLQLHLFSTMVVPILLYGSEFLGFEQVQSLEKIQLYFLKVCFEFKIFYA
jgi:hypothetical protein